jgi:G3E family GTPase
VDIAKVLDRGAFDLDRILKIEPDFLQRQPEDHNHAHGHDHDHHDHDHDHDHHHDHDDGHGHDDHGAKTGVLRHNPEVTSVSLRLDKPLSSQKFEAWIRHVLAAQGQDILRMKGILNMAGQGQRYVVHGVHMQIDGKPTTPWRPDEKRDSRIVFIGRKLDADALKQGFEGCVQQ